MLQEFFNQIYHAHGVNQKLKIGISHFLGLRDSKTGMGPNFLRWNIVDNKVINKNDFFIKIIWKHFKTRLLEGNGALMLP